MKDNWLEIVCCLCLGSSGFSLVLLVVGEVKSVSIHQSEDKPDVLL